MGMRGFAEFGIFFRKFHLSLLNFDHRPPPPPGILRGWQNLKTIFGEVLSSTKTVSMQL